MISFRANFIEEASRPQKKSKLGQTAEACAQPMAWTPVGITEMKQRCFIEEKKQCHTLIRKKSYKVERDLTAWSGVPAAGAHVPLEVPIDVEHRWRAVGQTGGWVQRPPPPHNYTDVPIVRESNSPTPRPPRNYASILHYNLASKY